MSAQSGDTLNTGDISKDDLLALTTDIVSAYVNGNSLPAESVPGLISEVYAALNAVAHQDEEIPIVPLNPAVPITESLTDDYLICLEDGEKFKSLKRHLRTKYDLTPAAYREKWGLPKDYPMVAPNYAKQRSKLAKKSGLGRSARS